MGLSLWQNDEVMGEKIPLVAGYGGSMFDWLRKKKSAAPCAEFLSLATDREAQKQADEEVAKALLDVLDPDLAKILRQVPLHRRTMQEEVIAVQRLRWDARRLLKNG